jgi:hypothetical protein
MEGNLWHNSLGPIEGAAGNVYYPETEDAYYSIISEASGCFSDTSNIVNFIFTGIADLPAQSDIFLYPNPVGDNLDIIFSQKPVSDITITIVDITGKTVAHFFIAEADLREIISIPTKELRNGLILLYISDPAGRVLISGKLIKL